MRRARKKMQAPLLGLAKSIYYTITRLIFYDFPLHFPLFPFFNFYFQEMHNKCSFYASWFIMQQERVLSSLLRWFSPPRLEDWSSMLTRTVDHCLRWSREIMAITRLLVTWKAWPRGTSFIELKVRNLVMISLGQGLYFSGTACIQTTISGNFITWHQGERLGNKWVVSK